MNTAAAPGLAPSSTASPAPSLRHLPLNLFGAVMSLAGLALAWRLAESAFGAPRWAGEAASLLALLAFLAQAGAYLGKLLWFPAAVRQDFDDPVTGNFFGQIPISLLLLSAVLMPHAAALAEALWSVGVVTAFAMSLRMGSRLLKGRLEPVHMLPVWLISGVGTLDIVVTGAHMPMAWAHEVNLFALAVGAIVALLLWVLIVHRLVFGEPLPPRMKPSLMILVAPFALGFLAWVNLFGQVDRFAGALFHIGLFMLLLVAPKIFRRDVPFAPSWWAIGFPLAALANAAMVFAGAHGGLLWRAVAMLLLAGLSVALAVLGWRTLQLVFSGRLLRA